MGAWPLLVVQSQSVKGGKTYALRRTDDLVLNCCTHLPPPPRVAARGIICCCIEPSCQQWLDLAFSYAASVSFTLTVAIG